MKKLALIGFTVLTFVSGCGKQGPQGLPGVPGTNGAVGASGASGAPGQDATPVTAVKFCSSKVTVYPTAFPEYGFCIAGHLYATYWDGHNAWTAEVVPGYYASTSTSAACNFTVAANCVVSN